jgi:hypothetical protein
MSSRNQQGFALVVSLSLMAFVLLLLLSIVTLTKIESQSSTIAIKQLQAEQNALLALDVAIGQLQKYTGPDQRTTARADLTNGANSTNSHWIGAYGSAVETDYETATEKIPADLADTSLISSTGSPARLLNWLVSGSETSSFNPSWSSGDVGSKGQILATPTPSVDPTGTITGLTATTAATDTALTITNTSGTVIPARLLVGANSVTSSLDSSGIPVDYVVAPTVDVQASDGSLNRYAWWVSDDGMKARLNLPQAGTDSSLSSSEKLEQQRNAFSNSEREAIELMSLDNDDWSSASPPSDNLIDTLYTPDQSVTSILTTPHAAFISSDSDEMSKALKYRFHDVTPNSRSVLSDTYAGGLKRDLSILLDESYTPSNSDATANSNRLWEPHSEDNDSDSTSFTGGFYIPTWQHLRSYAQTRIPTTGSDAFSLTARLPAIDKDGFTDDVGIAPTLTYFSMGFRVVPASIPAPGVEYRMALYPLVVLWNPYNFTLKAPTAEADGSNFEVGIYPTYNVTVDLEKIETDGTATLLDSFNFQRETNGVYADFEYIRFRLKVPDIPPGQSLIFSLPHTSSGDLYDQKNILENIEPEPGAYVSIPFVDNSGNPITIQAGDESLYHQLVPGASGGSFKNDGGGLLFSYLGAPDDVAKMKVGGSAEQTRLNENPSNSDRSWYSAEQSIGWDHNVATDPLQGPELLYYDTSSAEPAYVFLMQQLFSGQGNNAQLDTNQFMFSTRWIAQGNPRANRSGRTIRDKNYNVKYIASAGSPTTKVLWQKFINDEGPNSNRTSAGQGHDWIDGAPVDVSLFEFPYEDQPLQSIGQLQHANLSLIAAYPAYPIGNSLADFRIHGLGGSQVTDAQPEGWQLTRIDSVDWPTNMAKDMKAYYDISYLLNRTLWDQYYFSTVPATGTIPETLANPRHIVQNENADLQDPDESAAGLMLEGGFNINSTSEQAWRAILGGGNQLNFDPENPDASPSNSDILPASFPRLTRPNDGADPDDAWSGFRTLDEDQIAQLARNIVTEIRNRGPFVSVSDFVNRRLYDNPNTNDEDETFRGTIQAAIDITNSSANSGEYPANDATDSFWNDDPLIESSSTGKINQTSQYTHGYYSRAQLEGRLNSTSLAEKPYGNQSSFAPKYITQADILSKIGAKLTARSDTFTIRTYGETLNPVTNAIEGRAWCEAVVQRLPNYVDESLDAQDTPSTNSVNQTFGRKFKIISLKWLSPSDI